ncbi:MAG: lamin tail domain-containing protein, partial [Thermodesulfobacteriota bacterium]
NPGDRSVDISNWALNKGSLFLFPPETVIESKGFLVVALKPELFSTHYSMSAVGPLKQPLNRGKDKIELYDAQGKLIDKVSYKDEAPWPVSADGYSSSLERICPTADGDDSDNWTASPLPADSPKPSGSPGSPNAAYSSTLPPVIGKVKTEPEDLLSGLPLTVKAKIKSSTEQPDVQLLYRVIVKGVESPEETISMKLDDENEWFSAHIPAQSANTLVRYRIKASDPSGSQRFYPAENDIRPTLSIYAHDGWEKAPIPYGFIVHVGKEWIPPENQEPRRRPRGFNFFGFGNNQTEPPRPPRGLSAFVYVDPQSGKTELFDHINIVDRFNNRGYKAFFHKDQPLNGMTSVNIAFEGNERFLLAEPLAYDLYRRTGNVAPQCDFLRLWVD